MAVYLDNHEAMAKAAKNAGARFISVLGPNRYASGFAHPGEDIDFVDRQTEAHLPGMKAIMPRALGQLSDGSAGLSQRGIETLDLTAIFKDKTQNLFTESAGRFNSIGNAMVADRLAAAILRDPAGPQP